MPIRKPVAHRRLWSVIQDLMYLAARLTRHAHRLGLSFWQNNPWHGENRAAPGPALIALGGLLVDLVADLLSRLPHAILPAPRDFVTT